MTELVKTLVELRAKATPGPWRYGVRPDKSIWLSIGNPEARPHYQFDIMVDERDIAVVCCTMNNLDTIISALSAQSAEGMVPRGLDEGAIRSRLLVMFDDYFPNAEPPNGLLNGLVAAFADMLTATALSTQDKESGNV